MEIAVSLGIVSLALLGIFSLSLQNIRTQNGNKSELVASMLAQEGLELARNIRDENWITYPEVYWDLDINGGDGTYILDMRGRDELDDAPDSVNDAATILYADADGFYSHDNSGAATKYRRLITVSEILINGGPDYYLKIVSEVKWTDSGRPMDYKAETELYDWR